MDDVRIDPGGLSHQTGVDNLRRFVFVILKHNMELFSQYQFAIFAAEPDRLAPFPVDPCHDLFVYLAPQHHLHHIHGRGIGHPHPPDKLGEHPHPVEHFVYLRSSPVDDNRVQTDKFQEGDIPGKIGFQLIVDHGVSAIFNNDGFA